MTEQTRRRRQRTWSAFGDIKKMPSDYEIGAHKVNWTLREGRKAPLEQNPSSPGNLWFRTYREGSPLSAPDWHQFRDPDAMTYKQYVALQSEQESRARGVLDEYSNAGAQHGLDAGWRRMLARLFTPTRFPVHGIQQAHAYIGYLAPSAYITNATAFAVADDLRRVTLVSYRTRELQLAWPDEGFATGERAIWESDPAWQPLREALEYALTAYDWAEAFTAMNLVLLPTVDDVLLRQFRALAKQNGDEVTWWLTSFLQADAARRNRWSSALATFAVTQRPGNAGVLNDWIGTWAPRADAAAAALAEAMHGGAAAESAVDAARQARLALHADAGLGAPEATPAG